jgi:hypothetical protein
MLRLQAEGIYLAAFAAIKVSVLMIYDLQGLRPASRPPHL